MAAAPARDPYNEALELEKAIKKMAFNPKYDSVRYRAMVTAMRDCITELALAGEIGKLKHISEYSLDLLEPDASRGSKRYHYLKPSDLLHHIETLPTHQDALVSDISSDKTMNMAVVRSIIKADFLHSESMGLDCLRIGARLAENNDKDAWITFVRAVEKVSDGFKLATETIGRFNPEYLKENSKCFAPIKTIISKHKPSGFGWEVLDSKKIESKSLFDALMIIGCKKVIPEILKVCWLEFDEPFLLQRNMQRYDFTPDDQYRKTLGNAVHEAQGRYRHLATSYYLYELCREETLVQMRRPMSPAILAEVIELDGNDTPYGPVRFMPGKVGELIDVTLKAAMIHADWEEVHKTYSCLPERLLLKSNIYKGKKLSDELGL